MSRLRSAFLVAGLLLCFSSSLAFAFGPLWAGNAAGGGGGGGTCNPPTKLASLPRHLMVGLAASLSAQPAPHSNNFTYMAGMGVPWDITDVYFNGPVNLSIAPSCSNGGWQTFNTTPHGCGSIAYLYLNTSQAAGYVQTFTYYVMETMPGAGGNEITWLKGTTSGQLNTFWYFRDFIVLLQQIQTYGSGAPVIIHIEPDAEGYLQSSGNTAATTVPGISTFVGPDGFTPGLPNTLSGFMKTYVALRDHYAPSVLLGWHFTQWTAPYGFSPVTNPSAAVTAGNGVGAWYNSMGVTFDIAFQEFSDMDSGFYATWCGGSGQGTRGWYNLAAFTSMANFVNTIHTATGLPQIEWQIPSGSIYYDTDNNSDFHYQDNRSAYLLQSGNPLVTNYTNAGVIGLIFSFTQQSPFSQCNSGKNDAEVFDEAGDGVTNPAPIGIPSQALGIIPGLTTNNNTSIDADDDGGFIRRNAHFAQSLAVCP